MNKGLFALAMGTFALGIAEFLMMGILGNIAASMDISISSAGHFISAYALGVCVGAPALLFARRMALKKILLILSGIIALGNLCASFAPGYWTFMARVSFRGCPTGLISGWEPSWRADLPSRARR